MLVGQREKSQKYFDLSTFNHNLYDSNPWSSLGVMNFQKWELFSGSPGMLAPCPGSTSAVRKDFGRCSGGGGGILDKTNGDGPARKIYNPALE